MYGFIDCIENCFDYFCCRFKTNMNTVLKRTGIYFIVFLCINLIEGCASAVKITSVAEKNKEGDVLLKWEVSPDQEGDISIYSSQSDSSLETFTPVKTSNIADQVTVISTSSPDVREFYILKTSSALSGIISNRIIEMHNIKNFRDIGGYFNMENKQLKWGKIYRSGDLSSATLYDQERIRRLGINTVIDFRSEKSAKKYPILVHPSIRKIMLPIVLMDLEKLDELMNDETFTRADAIRYVQDSYIGIIENYKEEYAQMFDILTDENNYPILLTGSLGKDRVGLAAFFILYALGVSEAEIINDYMLSSQTIDILSIVENAQKMPEYMQEAVTALLSVNAAYLNYAVNYIKQKYDTVDNYLEKELKLSSGKKSILRKQMLYNQ